MQNCSVRRSKILFTVVNFIVIHKDIKPTNILIHPESKQVKLIDFGISSLLPKETTVIKNPNGLEGTLAYLAPEQTGRTGASPSLSGNVTITTPDVNPSSGLVSLQTSVVDSTSLVSQNICARGVNSSFTITGHRGLPPSPDNVLSDDTIWEDWRIKLVAPSSPYKQSSNQHTEKSQVTSKLIIEAQRWAIDKQGIVELIASPKQAPCNIYSVANHCQ